MVWTAQPGPQAAAIQATWCRELFYGGARGGGKTHLLLGDFLQDVPTYGSAWHGIIFRPTYKQLEELRKRSFEIFPETGGEFKRGEWLWTWPNGSTLKFRHLKRVQDATEYQGHEYTFIGWEELTNWRDLSAYFAILACLRSGHSVPTKRVRSNANPGGVGHLAVKQYFVDPEPKGWAVIVNEKTGLSRMFIPAKLEDNPALMRNDPDYEKNLLMVGSPQLVEAWRHGRWDVTLGSFFPEFDPAQHVIPPFSIPKNWQRITSFDWGSSDPWCALYGAISDGSIPTIPKGAIVIYKELYGAKFNGMKWEGLKLSTEEVARRIVESESPVEKANIKLRKADSELFKRNGGPSFSDIWIEKFKLNYTRGDTSRRQGWAQIRSRLIGENGRPMLFFFKNCCPHIVRTLPGLAHSERDYEDIEDGQEDHAPDALKVLCNEYKWWREGDDKASEIERIGNFRLTDVDPVMKKMIETAQRDPFGHGYR